MIPLIVIHEEDDESLHCRLYFVAPETLVQLTVAVVAAMLEELKPVGVPQLVAVVNDEELLYELDPDEQTVCTWYWYDVAAVSPVKL